MQSLNIFMRSLLDYAGLFPPESLNLQDSIINYINYQNHNQKNWLGKFILPANKIIETTSILSNKNIFSTIKNKIPLSIILTGCEKLDEFYNVLIQDIKNIENLENQFNEVIKIDSFEILPSKEIINTSHLNSFHKFTSHLNENLPEPLKKIELYCELPLTDNFFLEKKEEYLKNIKINNEIKDNIKLSLKLRTGGITPKQIPNSKDIAETIYLSSKYKIPLKATAGLHVPVPNNNPHVGAKLHGFLNVFSCMFFCYNEESINVKEMINILSSYSYPDFKFSNSGLQIDNYFISNNKLEELKIKYVKSFGTCSFEEPIQHLQNNYSI